MANKEIKAEKYNRLKKLKIKIKKKKREREREK